MVLVWNCSGEEWKFLNLSLNYVLCKMLSNSCLLYGLEIFSVSLGLYLRNSSLLFSFQTEQMEPYKIFFWYGWWRNWEQWFRIHGWPDSFWQEGKGFLTVEIKSIFIAVSCDLVFIIFWWMVISIIGCKDCWKVCPNQ